MCFINGRNNNKRERLQKHEWKSFFLKEKLNKHFLTHGREDCSTSMSFKSPVMDE